MILVCWFNIYRVPIKFLWWQLVDPVVIYKQQHNTDIRELQGKFCMTVQYLGISTRWWWVFFPKGREVLVNALQKSVKIHCWQIKSQTRHANGDVGRHPCQGFANSSPEGPDLDWACNEGGHYLLFPMWFSNKNNPSPNCSLPRSFPPVWF